MGVKQGDIDALEMEFGAFFSSIKISNREGDFIWEVINVYGPVQHERKADFLKELQEKLTTTDVPVLVVEILL